MITLHLPLALPVPLVGNYFFMFSKIKKIYIWLNVSFLFFYIKFATAASEAGSRLEQISQQAGFTTSSSRMPQNIVIDVVLYALGLLAVIFLILIIVAGIQWMTAGGNEEKITTAKNRLKNAAIGFAIVIISYAATIFITQALTQSTVQQSYSY